MHYVTYLYSFTMIRYTGYLIVMILFIIPLAHCSGRVEKDTTGIRLQIQPIPYVYISYDSASQTFQIGNELVERRITINAEKRFIFTTAFINKFTGRNYVRSPGEEFSFRANGTKLSGVTGDFEYIGYDITGPGDVKGLEITLRVMREEIGNLKVMLVYEVYPHTPVIRKWLEIENPTGSLVKIDSMQVESLNLIPGSGYDLRFYDGSASPEKNLEVLSPIIFNTVLSEGFRIGNEAPGMLNYSVLDPVGGSVYMGMRPYFQNYAFEIQLSPNENFTSPGVFILLFKGELNESEEILKKFLVECMLLSKPPGYAIWYENIIENITESEILDKAQMASRSGADIFCLSGRWMERRGDWTLNEDIHLNSLSQRISDLGMKFGLSLDLAVTDPDSQIIKEHPGWIVKSKDGSDYAVQYDTSGKMMCLGSEYALYMAYEMGNLVKELDLDYIKLTGPMIPDGQSSGCFAQEHIHRSSAESLWYIYDGLFAICNFLHNQNPGLIIQVSPETYSTEKIVDYALMKNTDAERPF